MRAFLRSSIVALVILSTGCATTGGKVFGTVAVASGIGSIYLMTTSSATLENGRAVLRDDHTEAAAGLLFASVAAMGGWFVSEYLFGKPWAMGGGGGGALSPGPEPAIEPAAAPAAEPAPAGDVVAPGPVTIVVQNPDRGEQRQLRSGWHIDPQDGQDELLDRDGELVIRIDGAGTVWNFSGAALGQVDMSGNCDVACRRARAHQMLLASQKRR